MTYLSTYQFFKNNFNNHLPFISFPEYDLEIHNVQFTSHSSLLLPGVHTYHCHEHNIDFNENLGHRDEEVFNLYPDYLKHADTDVTENRIFNYTIFKKASVEKANGIIFLFHGLNEKYWAKYLPWAQKLVENTGKTVILFPIAFHMNRSPLSWSDTRKMNSVAKTRKEYSPTIDNATFANAAISARIQAIPQRFLWSGLQTFYDVVQILKEIKSGQNPLIFPECSVDLFSYSIGSFLSEILMMANPESFFSNSRLFLFCGGPTLDRMRPDSKFILDSDATIAIYSFYTERFDRELKLDKRVAHYCSDEHPEGTYFKAMLNYHKCKNLREQRLREIAHQLKAVALKKDDVIPPNEVINTLKGEDRDIPVAVNVLNYDYRYDHINPFPNEKIIETAVDRNFNELFHTASEFLQ